MKNTTSDSPSKNVSREVPNFDVFYFLYFLVKWQKFVAGVIQLFKINICSMYWTNHGMQDVYLVQIVKHPKQNLAFIVMV